MAAGWAFDLLGVFCQVGVYMIKKDRNKMALACIPDFEESCVVRFLSSQLCLSWPRRLVTTLLT